MRIGKKEMLAGIPVLKVRDYLKKLSSEEFTGSELRVYFHLNRQQTDELLKELLKKDFLVKQGWKYHLTQKGRALCIARCVPAIDRDTADHIFQNFMERVKEVNRDDFYLYRVSKLLLFGSYLNPSNTDFGDIDIAFELERKIPDLEEFVYHNSLLVEEALRSGHYFPSAWEEFDYSRRMVLLKLKDRNPYISLHPLHKDRILETTFCRQIYPEEEKESN